MKKMLLNKKNLYIKLTAVLILMIVGILGIYTAFVQKIATGQCFNILDDSRERMGQMIVNEMQNEQDHLEAASYLLKNLMTDCDANEEMILQIMRASSADKSYAPLDYSDWELLIFAPDSSCMQLANSNRVATCHVPCGIQYSGDFCRIFYHHCNGRKTPTESDGREGKRAVAGA